MELLTIDKPREIAPDAKLEFQRRLEEGDILFFPKPPFDLPPDDVAFLLSCQQTKASYHKNIAYRPRQDRITGMTGASPGERARLRSILKRYTDESVRFLSLFFPGYAASWKLDYGSFRPQKEEGRDLPIHSKNDLMHVDAFPTRPTRGDRILRFFTNINPERERVWRAGEENFGRLAERFALSSGLLDRARRRGFRRRAKRFLHRLGLPVADRSPYDEFMLSFHHFLKENRTYQETAPRKTVTFPPNTSWMVFTDTVSHAVLSGQFALEQTFIISKGSLAIPENSPAGLLDRLAGAPMM